MCSFVSLKITESRPIMKFDGKNIICVCMWVCFSIVQFLSEMNICHLWYIIYEKLVKNCTIIKNLQKHI